MNKVKFNQMHFMRQTHVRFLLVLPSDLLPTLLQANDHLNIFKNSFSFLSGKNNRPNLALSYDKWILNAPI